MLLIISAKCSYLAQRLQEIHERHLNCLHAASTYEQALTNLHRKAEL